MSYPRRNAGLRGLLKPESVDLPFLHELDTRVGGVEIPESFDTSHGWAKWMSLGNAPATSLPGDDLTINGGKEVGNCVVEGTHVAGAEILGAQKVPYSGSLIRLKFRSGKELSVTPNHAVLTPRGFIRARFLNKGDYAIGTSGSEMMDGTLDGYLDESPAPVEDVVASIRGRRCVAVRNAEPGQVVPAIDFHGDERFVNGDVEIVWADRFLQRELRKTALRDPHSQQRVRQARQLQGHLHRPRPTFHRSGIGGASALGGVGVGGVCPPFGPSHSGVSQSDRLAASAALDAGFLHQSDETCGVDSGFSGEIAESFASAVALEERRQVRGALSMVERERLLLSTNLSASIEQPSTDGGTTDPELAANLISVFPGLIATDEIIDIDEVTFTGHVYDLSTDSHWYISNGIVSHNCFFAAVYHGLINKALEQVTAGPSAWVLRSGFAMPTANGVVGLYLGYQNGLPPGKSATTGPDNGTEPVAGFKWFQKAGIIKRWWPVDVGQLDQGTYDSKGVLTAWALDEDAEEEFAEHKPWLNIPEALDPIEGGHATYRVARTPRYGTEITWGSDELASHPWEKAHLQAAYGFQAPWEPDPVGYDFRPLDEKLEKL